ncbi:MAG TPA: glycosyl hydrolase family 28-related protein, partial [Pyrinomonadaceae bacterium]
MAERRLSIYSVHLGLPLCAAVLSLALAACAQAQGSPDSGGAINQAGALSSYTKARLPACPCDAGRVVRVTDDVRGLWVTDGAQWFPITSEASIRWFGAKPDDGADDSAALAAALAVAPTVRLDVGTYRIGGDLTVPAGKKLIVENGALISVDAARTLTLAGPFEAGLYQTFAGGGKVVFSGLNNSTAPSALEVFPQWWGARADGAADDLAALSKAVAAAAVYHGRVRLVGNYRISGPVSLPNGVTLSGDAGNSQNWAWITADGARGFSGNYLLLSESAVPSNQYSTLENIHFQVYNIRNARFEAVHIAGWSETSNVRNISFNVRDSSISRVLYFNNYGPAEFDNINLYYATGRTLVSDEPMYVRAVNGLMVRNLNYTAVSPKAPYFEGGQFALLEGLQIETHPTVASEPSITIYPGTGGVTFRDSNILTDVDNSTGVRILSNVFPDLGSYLIENVAAQRHTGVGKGSFDRLVVIRDSNGSERA